ncbi:MAG: SDR family NAD(P)-dependent oxidoreductase [Actinomycetota bacterium]|nr:SDR family NAD(P)-dependent oxidoreductase [Actinomycetota bacterium]
MTGRLQDKVAVVTGAGSGLGQATARMYAEEGAQVMCADRDEAAVARTVADIVASGGSATARRIDLTSSSECAAMIEATVEAYGRVDVVFACAGVAGAGDAASTTEEEWDRVIAINLTSKWLTFKHALPLMVAQGSGSIIVQASIGGLIGVPNIFPYAAAKGGCIGMVKQAAADFGPQGVRVNAIAPGTIVTPLVRESYAKGGGMSAGLGVEEGIRRAHERYPLRRLGTVEEFAYLATYVASDESGWTTGHTFVIDGGVTIV